ncbi:hypothetical protein H8D57_00475 [bacterium]|nr:hypothetical protein [bacterium]
MIWKFDPNNNVLLFTFTLGGHPEDIAITSTNVAYVAAGDDGGDPGLVYRYDARTGEILNGPANPIEGIGRGASRIAIADDNSVYVSCTFVNRVDKIVGDMKVSSFDVGERPVSLAVYQNSEE